MSAILGPMVPDAALCKWGPCTPSLTDQEAGVGSEVGETGGLVHVDATQTAEESAGPAGRTGQCPSYVFRKKGDKAEPG